MYSFVIFKGVSTKKTINFFGELYSIVNKTKINRSYINITIKEEPPLV